MIEPKDNLSSDQSFAPPPPPWRQNVYNQPAMPTPPMPPMVGNFSGGSLPGVGDLLSQAWSIFVSNAGTYIGITAVPFIVQLAIWVVIGLSGFSGLLKFFPSPMSQKTNLIPDSPSFALLFILGFGLFIIQLWSQIALIYAIAGRDRKLGIKEAYQNSFRKILSYFWIVIISIIVIGGGMFLFVVPGIVFGVWFCLAVYVFISEDVRGMSALLKSKEYVRGNGLAVFWRFLALGLIFIGISLAVSFAVSLISIVAIPAISSLLGSSTANGIASILWLPLQLIIAPFGTIYGFLVYERLRAMRGTFDFAPSKGKKAGFFIIGIIGWILVPLMLIGFAINALFAFLNQTKDSQGNQLFNKSSLFDLTNYQFSSNVNSGGNVNGGNNENSNSSLFQDTDKDGLSESMEESLGTNSNVADTDFDGLSDGDEVNTWKTKPNNPDTDGDGFRDGDEARSGYNPLGNGKTENN